MFSALLLLSLPPPGAHARLLWALSRSLALPICSGVAVTANDLRLGDQHAHLRTAHSPELVWDGWEEEDTEDFGDGVVEGTGEGGREREAGQGDDFKEEDKALIVTGPNGGGMASLCVCVWDGAVGCGMVGWSRWECACRMEPLGVGCYSIVEMVGGWSESKRDCIFV